MINQFGQEQTSPELITPETPTQAELAEQVATLNKRYTDLQSYHDKTRISLERQNSDLRKANTVFTPPKTADELEVFKTENPDWYGAMETVAHTMASNFMKPIQEELNTSKAEASLIKLQAAHPDVSEIFASEHFKQWANDQGPEIQAWLNEQHDADKVIRAISYYKAMSANSPSVSTAPNNLQASTAVSTHGSVVNPSVGEQIQRYSRKQIDKMHPAEYEKHYEAIKYASQNGLLTA